MIQREDTRSVSALLSQAFAQLSTLVRGEIDLAQAELTAKAKAAAVGVGMIAAGALVVIPALVLLLMALAALLTHLGIAEALSDLLSALVGLAVAGFLAWLGMQRLSADTLKPNRTITQLQRDASAAKEHLS